MASESEHDQTVDQLRDDLDYSATAPTRSRSPSTAPARC